MDMFPRDSLPIVKLCFITLSLLMLQGCVTMQSGAHHDESASFDHYRSFAWISDQPLVLATGDAAEQVSPLSRQKIIRAVENTLNRRGYHQHASGNRADFILSYTLGSRERMDVAVYPTGYRESSDWNWQLHSHDTEVIEHHYTEGTLGIDIFDGVSKRPVWHGWATKVITDDDRDDPSEAIQDAVNAILEQFPPGQ